MTRTSLRTRAGFTLIELMLAAVIAIVVVAAIYNLFSNQTKQFLYQDLQMEMHQNLRLSTEAIARSARMAGYGTGGATRGLFGYGGSGAAAGEPLPAIIPYDGGATGTDAATFVYMDPALNLLTAAATPAACDSTTLTLNTSYPNYASRIAQYQPNNLIMCVDYAATGAYRSFLWRVRNINATAGTILIEDGTTYTDFRNDCGSGDNLPLIMVCSRAEVTTFYIDSNAGDGVGAGSSAHPILMMDTDFNAPDNNDVPLVDHIEDLQLQYCLGTSCPTTGWVNSFNPVTDILNVRQVRIAVVARSARTNPDNRNTRSPPFSLLNHTGVGSADQYWRQVLSTDITVRNLRLQNLDGTP